MFGFITFIKGMVAAILTVLQLFFGIFFGDFTAPTKPLQEDCKLNFAVISDVHMTEEKARADMLRFGLQDMQEFESPLDALILSGDITDHGEREEWENVASAFADYTPAKNIILAQGNHDTWTGDDDYALSREHFFEFNEKIAGREIDNVYYSTKVNGYTFIVLGSEADHTSQTVSDEQVEWLRTEMEKASKDGLPIFVINHWPINESHGLPETWGDDEPMPDDGGIGDKSAEVEKILKSYNNVFYITGHIHSGFTKPGQEDVYGYLSVESDGSFHSVNLPQYMYLTLRGRIANGTGFTFEVYEDKVEIRARSFSAGVWYTDYDWSFDLV